MDSDEVQIETSLGEAIRIAKEQKSISLERRAEETYAEYRRQKSERIRRTWISPASLLTPTRKLQNRR
jgi:hypothetical protein